MAKIKINDVEYDTDDMSDNAKAQVASLQFNEAHMNRLKNELAIADTARIAYINALKMELDKDDKTGKSWKVVWYGTARDVASNTNEDVDSTKK